MSFNNEDILTLAKAGFTAEQIAALNSVQPVQEIKEPVPEVKEPVPEVKEPVPEVKEPSTVAPHSVDDVLAAISGLSASIQNANLLNAQMPTEHRTAESILASIIAPPKKEEIN